MRSFFYSTVRYLCKCYRIIAGSVTAFVNNDDSIKASALTYYTLVSIVPFFAVAFGIASGFGFAEYLENQLTYTFEDQPEIISHVIQFAKSLLQSTKGSVIAGVGLIVLLYTNISLIGSIERALNDIWKVREPRTWAKKFTEYLAIMILCPIIFVVLSSFNVFVMSQITQTAEKYSLLEVMSPYLQFIVKATPLFLSILLFIVLYVFIPNTPLNVRPRIIAGILAGIAFQIWQWIYLKIQVLITSYDAVYGTFAALPLFLLWLQTSWHIVLAGAEIAAHIENDMTNYPAKDMRHISQLELSLLILRRCIVAYSHGAPPMTALKIAQELGIPLLVVQQMIDILEDHDILVEVSPHGGNPVGYQPSRDARLFTIQGINQAIDTHTKWDIEVKNSPELQRIESCIRELDRLVEESPANINLQQLTDELHAVG